MKIRFVTKTIHAYLDYPVALSLVAMPFILGLGSSGPWAVWLSVGTGIAAFVLTVLTDHKTGLIPVIPYSVHVWIDRLVGVVFVIAPFVLGFTGLDAIYYWANAAAVLLVTVVLNAPDDSARISPLRHA
jgi:hypothetical protein